MLADEVGDFVIGIVFLFEPAAEKLVLLTGEVHELGVATRLLPEKAGS